MLDCIASSFSGAPGAGVFSPAVQQTMYDTQRLILARVPQVRRMCAAHNMLMGVFVASLTFPGLISLHNLYCAHCIMAFRTY